MHKKLKANSSKTKLKSIKTEMKNAYTLEAPLDVDLGLGKDWLEAY
ncbi:hypothetical protein [Aquimarina sp. Aq78]|nr:hypothetical protein [Aquimarina sp. Aq78]